MKQLNPAKLLLTSIERALEESDEWDFPMVSIKLSEARERLLLEIEAEEQLRKSRGEPAG